MPLLSASEHALSWDIAYDHELSFSDQINLNIIGNENTLYLVQ